MTASDHRLEQIPQQRLWYRGSKIMHGNNDRFIFNACRNGDCAIGGAVGGSIGDQVSDELIEPIIVCRKVTVPVPQMGQRMPGKSQAQLIQTIGHQLGLLQFAYRQRRAQLRQQGALSGQVSKALPPSSDLDALAEDPSPKCA